MFSHCQLNPLVVVCSWSYFTYYRGLSFTELHWILRVIGNLHDLVDERQLFYFWYLDERDRAPDFRWDIRIRIDFIRRIDLFYSILFEERLVSGFPSCPKSYFVTDLIDRILFHCIFERMSNIFECVSWTFSCEWQVVRRVIVWLEVLYRCFNLI